MMKKIIIAIDGVSSTGKSNDGKRFRQRNWGIPISSTGAMYRAVTLYSLQHGFLQAAVSTNGSCRRPCAISISLSVFNPETGRPDTYLNGVKVEKEIRGMEVANRVSPIAA